ncbi:MetQ/NlpA family ABC transporter substrate-binding protein [Virgibacillus ainsalahensis]
MKLNNFNAWYFKGRDATEEKTTIKFGVASGPRSDMVTKALKPLLEDKGYTVENTEPSDYIQPNNALNNGDIDANLFQHKL